MRTGNKNTHRNAGKWRRMGQADSVASDSQNRNVFEKDITSNIRTYAKGKCTFARTLNANPTCIIMVSRQASSPNERRDSEPGRRNGSLTRSSSAKSGK